MKHVIIGNGPAGVAAAETIRARAAHDDILLVGAEAAPYARMAIPSLLIGAVGDSGLRLRPNPNHFNALRIGQKTGLVRRVDSDFRTVTTDDGSCVGFDTLLIATGARSMMPVIPGIRSAGVHACWTLDDARRIMRLAAPGARVVLAGAGLIGSVVMGALAARGVRLTVVEKNESMVPGMLCKGAGDMLRQWCEHRGIAVRTSAGVDRILSCQPHRSHAVSLIACLSTGEQLGADLIVTTTGARPNVRFLRNSGIRCRYGVLADATMQTNVPGIYAAGDCAEVPDADTGEHVITSDQQNAVEGARCAALNMAGGRAVYRGARPLDAVESLGLSLASLGRLKGLRGGEWTEARDDERCRYLRLEFQRDVLVGANAVGLPAYTPVLRELIGRRVPLGAWKDRLLKNPALIREAYRACAGEDVVAEADA